MRCEHKIFRMVTKLQYVEFSAELDEQLRAKAHYFNLGGKGVRTSDKEAMQSLYSLTMCLDADKDKITAPAF